MGDVHEAGDHLIVIGRVVELEVQTPTLPLLFFQGGYGTFAPRSLVLPARGRLTEPVRMADAARLDFEQLAADVGLECRVFAAQEDHTIIVATAGGHAKGIDPVGAVLPFFPPFGYPVAAWGSPSTRQAWFDAFPTELSEDDRQSLNGKLDAIRRHGWGLTFDSAGAREAQVLVDAMAKYGQTPDFERRLVEVGRQIAGLNDPSDLDEHTARKVRTITVPVFGPSGPVLYPTLYGLPDEPSLEFVERARDALLSTCRALSERFGGTANTVL
jgi:hypothetical protein